MSGLRPPLGKSNSLSVKAHKEKLPEQEVDILMFCFTNKWHDWVQDGFASRWAKIARKLGAHPSVRRLVIVNVPSSILTLFAKPFDKSRRAVRSGAVIDKGVSFELRKVCSKTYTLDYYCFFPRDRHHPLSFKLNGLVFDDYLVKLVKRVLGRLGMKNVVLWLNGPLPAKYIGSLGEEFVVYDAGDEWLFHPGYQRIKQEIMISYNLIKERADIVFCAHKNCAEVFFGGKAKIHAIPNGVDPERFALGGSKVPPDIANIPKPIAGYVGVLQTRIDVNLATEVARFMPDVSFVFVGPMTARRYFSSLFALENVYYLGPRNHNEIHKYLQAFDVCIMPHEDSHLTRNMDPVKIYEYLAAYKPVVATNLPSLDGFGRLIMKASSAGEFADAINKAILGDWILDEALVSNFIEASTWDVRVDEMLGAVRRLPHSSRLETSKEGKQN